MPQTSNDLPPIVAPTDNLSDGFVQLPRHQIVLTMGGIMLALLLASLDQTVVGTSIPRIVADLGGFDRFTWITTGYIVASTTAIPIIGRLTDLHGRKSFYLAGISVFLIGSVLCGFSQNMGQLIAFRTFQGLGGGTLMALAFVTVGDLFQPADRGKYQGLIAGVFGISSLVGPTLGGFITDTFNWQWIFFINLPIGIPVGLLFLKFFPVRHQSGLPKGLDVRGMILLIISIVPLLIALSMAGVQYKWASPQIIVPIVVSSIATPLFFIAELRSPSPIMPLHIYKSRIVSLSMVVVFCTGFGMFGSFVFIPLFFQGALGASPTSSGSFLTPMMLSMVLGSALWGQALSRLGGHYRILGIIGLAIMGIGVLLLADISRQTPAIKTILYMSLMGFGMGTTFPTFNIAVQNAVPYKLLGTATAATQFWRSIGGALGLAILGSIMIARFGSGLGNYLTENTRDQNQASALHSLIENPQILMDPDPIQALSNITAGLKLLTPNSTQALLEALRVSLTSAIGDIFLVTFATTSVAIIATLFIKELPLRR